MKREKELARSQNGKNEKQEIGDYKKRNNVRTSSY
jgi:hypothetical protein